MARSEGKRCCCPSAFCRKSEGRQCLLSMIALVIFSAIGGGIFHSLEFDAERQEAMEIANATSTIAAMISNSMNSSQKKQLEAAFERVSQYLDRKQAAPALNNLHWTMSGATFFSFTVLTTIGYGNFAPVTPGGKAFTCIFAMLGVVVSAWVLNVVIAWWKTLLEYWVMKRLLKWKPENMTKLQLAKCKAVMIALVFSVLSVLLAAWADKQSGKDGNSFNFWGAQSTAHYGKKDDQPWGFGDSYYFTIVSWSTVGLGDYVLEPSGGRGIISNFFIITLGLSLFAGMFDAFRDLGSERTLAKSIPAYSENEIAKKDSTSHAKRDDAVAIVEMS